MRQVVPFWLTHGLTRLFNAPNVYLLRLFRWVRFVRFGSRALFSLCARWMCVPCADRAGGTLLTCLFETSSQQKKRSNRIVFSKSTLRSHTHTETCVHTARLIRLYTTQTQSHVCVLHVMNCRHCSCAPYGKSIRSFAAWAVVVRPWLSNYRVTSAHWPKWTDPESKEPQNQHRHDAQVDGTDIVDYCCGIM